MKIVHVLPVLALRGGGPPVAVAECALAMQRLGVESRIFATDLPGPPVARARAPVTAAELPLAARTLDTTLAPVRWPHRFAYAPALMPPLERAAQAADLIVIHSLFLYPQYAGWRAAERTRTPYVVAPRGALAPPLRRRGRARKALNDLAWQGRMLRRASALQFATEEEAELAHDIAPRVRRLIVPLGVDTAAFAQPRDGDRFREQYLGGHDGAVVLSVGRLARKKGQDILLRAFARIADAQADAVLVLAGPDDQRLRRGLEALAQRLGVAPRVFFTGMLYPDDRLAALSAATVWALPSDSENFAVAVMEALAAGLPVVVSPGVNLAPRLRAAGAGLVAEATPDAFAQALDELLGDRRRREDLGRAAREFASDYDWSRVAERTLRTYEALLGGAP